MLKYNLKLYICIQWDNNLKKTLLFFISVAKTIFLKNLGVTVCILILKNFYKFFNLTLLYICYAAKPVKNNNKYLNITVISTNFKKIFMT